MNKKIFILLLSPFLVCVACSENSNIDPNIDPIVDTTTTCKSIFETGSYSTFFKPQSGYVGDPMPYFNSTDNTFYLYYLQDWRNGASTDHPIYVTKTTNYGSSNGFYESIPCGDANSQEQFLGTGSFIKAKDGVLYSFYTGHNSKLYPAEKILMATSTDMITFTKVPEFAIVAPDGYDKNNFRDPFVYYDPTKSAYVMLVTSIKDGKGVLVRYVSTDLLAWNLINPLTDFDSDAEILECPDMFKMGNKWYLLFSRINRDEHRKTFYRVADSPDGPWIRSADETGYHETFDGLYMYAAKSAANNEERYLSGWCSTGQEVNGKNELDWAGSLISHEIVQQPNGCLYPKIPKAVEEKFNVPVKYLNLKSKGNVSGTEGDYILKNQEGRSYVQFNRNKTSIKISMKIDATKSDNFGFSFGACDDLSEVYSVSFDLTSSNHWAKPCLFLNKEVKFPTRSYSEELNFTPLIVPENKIFNIKIIIEKSICILYVNDNVAFTNRIYKMDQNPWTIFVDEGTIGVSDLFIHKNTN